MPHCAVIFTALDVEYEAVRAHLTDLTEEQHPQGNVYERGYFSSGKYSWHIAIVQTRKGDVKAGIQTERAISHFRPSIVIFVGVAGGVKDVSLGDVVIADKVYAYESGKDDSTFQPRPEMGMSSFRLIERAQAEVRKDDWLRRIAHDVTGKPPHAFIGPIAAGEKVVVSKLSATYTFLRQHYSDSIAVDMEDYGFLEAARANSDVASLVIRGVSDLIDGKEVTDKLDWQKKAACNASAFAFEVIAKLTGEKGIPTTQSTIPYPRNPYFTGREDILTNLNDALTQQKAAALSQSQAIFGLGGIGKTQTAVEYAYRHRDEYTALLWVRSDSREAIVDDFVTLAELLNLPEKDAQDQFLTVRAITRWFEANAGWLLILDNADDPGLLQEFLPRNMNGHIILTSRAQIFDTVGIANPLELKQMAHQEARKFLMTRTGRSDLDGADAEALDELIGEFDGLPLALEQAGAYIVRMKSSFRNYLSAYKARGLELLEKMQPVVGKYPRSVATTWLLNFEEVERISSASADLLRLSAFLSPDKIPFELIGLGAVEFGPTLCDALENVIEDRLVLDEVLEPLTQFSLISKDIESQTYDMHRLVQTVIKDNMDETAQRSWAEHAVKAVAKTFPSVEFSTWGTCERLLSHALTSAGLIDRWRFESEEAASLLNRTGIYLIERARYSEAEPLYRKALEIREKVFGAEHPLVAESLNNMATLYYYIGKYGEGESLCEKAIDIRKKAYGTEHALVAVSLNNLGLLYNCQGKYTKAEPTYVMALKIREKVFGTEHPLVAESLSNLAGLYYAQGNYADAETIYKRSIEIEKVALGPDHPELAASLNNLALIYHVQGKYSEAEPLYKRSLEIWETTLGSKHPKVAASLSGLAVVYDAQGKYTEAEQLHKRSLEIWENVVGPDHPEVASCLSSLGLLYHSQKQYTDAEPLFERALTIRQKIFGPEHAEVAKALNNLGMLYHSQKKMADAERVFEKAIAMFEKTLGSNHSEMAASLNNLAALYNALGKYAEAESLYKRCLGIWEKSLGPEHPQVAIGLNNLGALYYAWVKYEAAEPFYSRAIKIWQTTLGHEHPNVATGLENIADLYIKMGKIEDAKECKKKADMIRMKEKRNTS